MPYGFSKIFYVAVTLVGFMVELSGCSSVDQTKGITFQEKVLVTNINPSTGGGGLVVAINGSGFSEVTHVFFGPNEAAILTVADTSVVVKVPAGTAGAADVMLENDAGESVTFAAAFTYTSTGNCGNAPQIDPVPALAGTNGDAVEIHGKNFVVDLNNSTTFSIGGELADLALTGQVLSTTSIIVKVPNLDSKCPTNRCTVDIVAINPDGCQTVLAGGFTYIRSDADGDGLTDLEEASCNSDPLQIDTDGDCPLNADPKLCVTNDYYECTYSDPHHVDANGKPIHLDARKPDSDNDGLNDYEEIVLWGADPLDSDSDCDMVEDGDEVAANTVPTTADPAIFYPGVFDPVTSTYSCNGIGSGSMTIPVSAFNPRVLSPVSQCKVDKITIRGKALGGVWAHFSVGDNLMQWSANSAFNGNGNSMDIDIPNPHVDQWIPAGVTGITIDGFSGDYPSICKVFVTYKRAY